MPKVVASSKIDMAKTKRIVELLEKDMPHSESPAVTKQRP